MRRPLFPLAAVFLAISLDAASTPGQTTAREFRQQAIGFEVDGKYREAVAAYTKAIEHDGGRVDDFLDRGSAWEQLGEYEQAMADYGIALRQDPRHPESYCYRGLCWQKMGKYEQAIADFQHAARLAPEDFGPEYFLGWLQATCPDAKYRDRQQALASARRCYERSNRGRGLDLLAAAYALNGDFAQAQAWQLKAIANASNEEEKTALRAPLKLYRQGKPWIRDPKTIK